MRTKDVWTGEVVGPSPTANGHMICYVRLDHDPDRPVEVRLDLSLWDRGDFSRAASTTRRYSKAYRSKANGGEPVEV
jgi:hypothetical protein